MTTSAEEPTTEDNVAEKSFMEQLLGDFSPRFVFTD